MAKSKVFSLIYNQLVKWFVKTVWPWIVENVWPEIQRHIVDIVERAIRRARDAMYEWMEKRNSAQEKSFQTKASEAEEMARNADTDADAKEHRAIAQVWRKVAEGFRQENEALKAKLDDALKKSASDFKDEMRSMNIKDIIEEGDDACLKLRGAGTLPGLPAPGDKS